FTVQFGKRRTMKMRINQLLEVNMLGSKSPLARWRMIVLTAGILSMGLLVGCFRAGADEAEPATGQETRAKAPVPEQKAAATAKHTEKNALPGTVASKGSPDKDKTSSRSQRDRSVFRYGGKRFAEWRETLRDDLKPEVRVEAMKALSAFGTNGYG